MGNFGGLKVIKRNQKSKKSKQAVLAPEISGSDSDSSTDSGSNASDDAELQLNELDDASPQNASGKGPIFSKSKKDIRLKKLYAKLREEALDIIMEREMGPSITTSGLHFEAERLRKKQKKIQKSRDRRAQRQLKDKALQDAVEEEAAKNGDVFMIDVKPTPIDQLQGRPADAEEEPGLSRVSRPVRRRQQLIEKQRGIIEDTLGVSNGSAEKSDEVQKLLDDWIVAYDEKLEKREQNKAAERAKVASRRSGREERALEGSKGKEKTKSGRNKAQTISRN